MLNHIFDSHAHYDDEAFTQDRHEIIKQMHKQGVCRLINVGANIVRSKESIALAAQYPFIYASVGIHPCDVKDAPCDYIQQLELLIKQPKVVAVGEIGLDYHYEDNAPREVQMTFFEAQLQLAKQYKLPVIIHDREAHGDTLDLLKKHKPTGVVHCFSGSVEMANEIIKLGMYIGLGGAVTFKSARTPIAVATAIPVEYMVLETDAPYMTPVPFRGKRCNSAMIIHTAERIANARSEQGNHINTQELLDITRNNATKLFKVPLEDSYDNNVRVR